MKRAFASSMRQLPKNKNERMNALTGNLFFIIRHLNTSRLTVVFMLYLFCCEAFEMNAWVNLPIARQPAIGHTSHIWFIEFETRYEMQWFGCIGEGVLAVLQTGK